MSRVDRQAHLECPARTCDVLRRFERAVRVPEPRRWTDPRLLPVLCLCSPRGTGRGWTRDRIVAEINARDIPAFHGSCPEVYLEKAFDGTGLRPAERLPVARELGETSLVFLTHPTLTTDDVERTCTAIERVFSEAAA